MRSRLLQLGAAAIFALSAGLANAATNVNLGFILDGSGSVSTANFNASRTALANAISANVPGDDPDFTYTIGVAVFGANGLVKVPAITVTNANKAAVVAAVGNVNRTGINTGATNFNAGFAALNAAFGGSVAAGDISIANMTTDGNNNTGGVPNSGTLSGNGWDSLSFEAVGAANTGPLVGLGFDTNGAGATLINNTNQITDPLNDAFVIKIADFGQQYADVINRKVRASTGAIPLPAGLPLLAGGLMILGFVGRRRKAA